MTVQLKNKTCFTFATCAALKMSEFITALSVTWIYGLVTMSFAPEVVAAACMMMSMPLTALSTSPVFVRSTRIHSTPDCSKGSELRYVPKSSYSGRSTSLATIFLPIKPVAPATKTFFLIGSPPR